jgi:antirestriction protein ArdC
MAATKTKPTAEERAARHQADRELTREAVEELRSSEGWQRWLSTRRHFHRYSLANQLLIAAARPTAMHVAGFRKWLELGYAVQRGERAIRIWAPCPPSRKQVERWEREGRPADQRPRTYFRLVAVFAQDQVAALPPPATPAPLEPPIHDVEGDELEHVMPNLAALAREIGCTIQEEPLPGSAHGCYEPDSGRITIDVELSANAKVKTCCHELAHALIRRERQDDDPGLDYAAEELVVESVAYTCVGALGIRSDGYSVPYLASWAERSDLSVLEQTAGLIDRLASRIENAVL